MSFKGISTISGLESYSVIFTRGTEMIIIERSTQSVSVQMETAEISILMNSLNRVIHVIDSAAFRVRIGTLREQAIELQKSISALDSHSTIHLSIDELTTLNNALNEVVNGICIDDFESVIKASVQEVETLLKFINGLIEELSSGSQSCEPPQSVYKNRKEFAGRQKCSLIAEEYQADFYLRRLDDYKDSVGIIVVLTRLTAPGSFSAKSIAQTLPIYKLENFAKYLEQHITLLKSNFEHESNNFLQCKSIFQCHALPRTSCRGITEACTLRFMVSIDKESEVFMGVEAAITFDSISHFTNSVNAFLAQLSG